MHKTVVITRPGGTNGPLERTVPAHTLSHWRQYGWTEKSTSTPARSDTKSAWVDYAVEHGVDRDEAQAATKDELVALFAQEG